MALKNYKQGGGFATGSANTIVPAIATGKRLAITSFIIHNQHTSDVSVSVDVYDGTNAVVIVDESILTKESFYYDMKLVLGEGESLRVTTDNANIHIVVSGDE